MQAIHSGALLYNPLAPPFTRIVIATSPERSQVPSSKDGALEAEELVRGTGSGAV